MGGTRVATVGPLRYAPLPKLGMQRFVPGPPARAYHYLTGLSLHRSNHGQFIGCQVMCTSGDEVSWK